MFVFELGYIQMYSHTHAYVCRGVYRERAYECMCGGTERDRESERHKERDRETKKKPSGRRAQDVTGFWCPRHVRIAIEHLKSHTCLAR